MININGKEWSELKDEDIGHFLADPDTEESFFVEFKSDEVGPERVAGEISALANTFGGYIFFGVSDSKQIDGCSKWNEERIQHVIHDAVSPTVVFDVKKFVIEGKTIFVLRIDEGAEPPYITGKGKIFERVSSGSHCINDSLRLSQMYSKHEKKLNEREKKISIPPVSIELGNLYGYIDLGFSLTVSDEKRVASIFTTAELKKIAQNEINTVPNFNLSRIGQSIVYTPGGLSVTNGQLPAHLGNFIEIMHDGSARMRVLLTSKEPGDTTVNMIEPFHYINSFREFYKRIFGTIFPDLFIYAKKYEKMEIVKQFQPIFVYEENMVSDLPILGCYNQKHQANLKERQAVLGIDRIITSDRIPKSGLRTIDRKNMSECGIKDYSPDSIILELFFSRFVEMGFPFDVPLDKSELLEDENE